MLQDAKTMKGRLKPSIQELFNIIEVYYAYPCSDTQFPDRIIWPRSQDIESKPYLKRCMELAENFVECVIKTKELPYVFDKSLTEPPRLIENCPLGGLFYEMISIYTPNQFHSSFLTPQNPYSLDFFYQSLEPYEFSENVKILQSIARSLNLQYLRFTGNPLSPLHTNCLLEGDIINSLVLRLREATKKGFKLIIEKRKDYCRESFRKSKQYIERIYANFPFFDFFEWRVYYTKKQEDLFESDKHLQQFLNLLKTAYEREVILGWWWKREYIREIGYYYSFFVFHDTQKDQDIAELYNYYKNNWYNLTEFSGNIVYPSYQPFIKNTDPAIFRTNPIYHSGPLNLALSYINLVIMRDIYLRLPSNPKIDNLGMGPLPKLSEQGRSIIETRKNLYKASKNFFQA